MRATKIVATLGPASNDLETLSRLINAGVNVVRLNFSHGKAEDHLKRAALVREASRICQKPVAIMADLQGPKIRVGKFENGMIELTPKDTFILDADWGQKGELGNQERVGLDYKELPRDLKKDDLLLLNDGLIVLRVEKIQGNEIHTIVKIGGPLSNNKGINLQGGGLSAPALTAKDMEDIKTAMQLKAEYLAVSFPKTANDILMARQLANIAGEEYKHKTRIIAKIERAEAIPALTEILEVSDGIMVARGDLAVEVGNATVPALQKHMIKLARKHNKLVITATQMMESMIHNAVPTRAEVSDVANAVLDGTDSVMLSAETAAGKYPVETVEQMHAICVEAEKADTYQLDADFMDKKFSRTDQSIAYGAMFIAYHLRVKMIVALTESGSTPLWMSRQNIDIPIVAMTTEKNSLLRMMLFRNVHPLLMTKQVQQSDSFAEVERVLLGQGMIQKGDTIVITWGEEMGTVGSTNCLKIMCIGG